MSKRKMRKGQTMIGKTTHRKPLKTEVNIYASIFLFQYFYVEIYVTYLSHCVLGKTTMFMINGCLKCIRNIMLITNVYVH
jgi:hypothetical protein